MAAQLFDTHGVFILRLVSAELWTESLSICNMNKHMQRWHGHLMNNNRFAWVLAYSGLGQEETLNFPLKLH